MRPGLLWLLGITLGLTAFVLWWPEPISESSRARVRMAEPSTPSTSPLPVASNPTANGSPPSVDAALLPAELVRIELEPAKFDPFLGAQPPLKPQVLTARAEAPATRVAQPQFMPPEPSLPAAPPLNYRFLGSMIDPGGMPRAYLAKGEAAVPISVGTLLDEGYVVQAIEPSGIRLHYPALNAQAVIPVPALQNSVPNR